MSLEGSATSDEEETYKEESPCGRWHRRNVKLNDVPGIDMLYQGMDMEEGVEVVWNEMNIPTLPLDDENLSKLLEKLQKLTKLEHPNMLKLYGSWYNAERCKVVFITEYYSAGSVCTFIQRRTRVNKTQIPETLWKRWCRQVLSALAYLHERDITHGYVTTDTVFIQHDGFVKLGSVVPSTVQDHIATCSRSHRQRHRHYCAPEYVQKMVHRRSSSVDGKKSTNSSLHASTSSAPGRSLGSSLDSVSELSLLGEMAQAKTIHRPFSVDIYAFGIFFLEILRDLSEFKATRESTIVTLDDVKHSILSLESHQQDLVNLCMQYDGSKRPDATVLLKLNVFYEVPSLRVMCVNMLLHADDLNLRQVEESTRHEGQLVVDNEVRRITPPHLDIEKIEREIKNGMHSTPEVGAVGKISPIRFYKPFAPDQTRFHNFREVSAEDEAGESVLPDQTTSLRDRPEETRLLLCIKCQLNPSHVSGNLHLKLEFQMNDSMVRMLSTDICDSEDPDTLVDDIISYGLLNKLDRAMVLESLEECLEN